MDNKKIVLSGIRPTGQLHLGNYLGALSNFVKMQNEGKYDSYYFIADLHALTTNPDPKELHTNVRHILAEYLAAGLDPEKSTIFVQSDVPEVSEMYLLLNMHVGIGELMRTAAFKDKARKALGITAPTQGDDDEDVAKEIIGASTNKRVNAGLLTYPTLMAVDILIQRADFVPVGKDQEQHLELTRRFARRFNSFYKVDYFNEPQNFNFGSAPVKVPGLDGSGKMGKSEGNCIYLVDDEKTIRKKVMRAVPVHHPQARRHPRQGRVLHRGLQQLLHPLRRPQEGDCRGYRGHDHAHPRAHPGHRERQCLSAPRARDGCRACPCPCRQDAGRRARNHGYHQVLIIWHWTN